MRKLKDAEINRMIDHSAFSFSDTCTIDTKTVTRNDFGEEIATFTSGDDIYCGFELVGGKETQKGELIVTNTQAKFRLPITTTVSIEDRITLKERYNQTVSYTFEIVSEPVKNLDCIVVDAIYIGY